MSDHLTSVVDENGNVHSLLPRPLGRGGQGVVYRTRNPNIAVKLLASAAVLDAPSGEARAGSAQRLWNLLTDARGAGIVDDEDRRRALRRRLEDVRLLPLPELHLAQPLSVLHEHAGYTMRLLTGMVPIRSLIAEPGRDDLAAFYLDTGGLGRRLALLSGTASLLARLHAVPLVYADVSPNNVFVSESKEETQVWLIDIDNLDYLSSHGASIHTPGFGAPEVVTGRVGVTTLSDAYAFAVLAFHVLAQIHPFLGDRVEEGGWDEGEDREQQAFRGELPWVEDRDDDSNHTVRGIPRELVLSRPLRDAFARTFGPGRLRRELRPGVVEWAEILRRAVDRIVVCSGCGSTFDVTGSVCRFCTAGRRPEFIHMQVNRWDPESDETETSAVSSQPVWHKMLGAGSDGVVLRHVVEPVAANGDDPPVLRVRVVPRGIAIEPLGDRETHVVVEGRMQRLDRETRLPLPRLGSEAYLHFGALDRPHRLAVLRHYPGGI